MAKGKQPPESVSFEPSAPANRMRMNAGEMAMLLRVTRPTIAKWVDMGAPCLQRGRQGVSAEFDAPSFLEWHRVNVLATKSEKPADTLYEREALADIALKEERLRQMREEVVDRSAALLVIRAIFKQTAFLFRQAPRRYGAQLVGLPDMVAAVSVFSRVVENVLRDVRVSESWIDLRDELIAQERERIT